ncbi:MULTISPECIES: hypothetical protein [unclassified Microcoleus]|uniref:hypothetical protein n=1 Tax=unclassified Microcoleus TaxID=2642155 RepID=UPI002FD357B1
MLWNRHLACSDISHGQDARATINQLINYIVLWNRHLACSDISHGQDARATINQLIILCCGTGILPVQILATGKMPVPQLIN